MLIGLNHGLILFGFFLFFFVCFFSQRQPFLEIHMVHTERFGSCFEVIAAAADSVVSVILQPELQHH